MFLVRQFLDAFWNPDVWLPPNVTWADIEPNDKIQYADHRDLMYPLPLAFCLIALRYVLERIWFTPVALSLGIRNSRQKKAQPNPVLEKVFSSNPKIGHKQVHQLAKELDWTERQVERWWRLRKNQNRPTLLKKCSETAWRLLYYTFAFCYGLWCLWGKPWMWNIQHCWYGYPHQSVPKDVWCYYMISLAFYWSLMFSQFVDVKRKDFWQMFIHHKATICLLSFSWVCNLTRIGTLVLLIHDCADIFLEAAKLTKYLNYQRVCDLLFVIFTLLWIVTRLVVFPFWIIKSTSIEAPMIVEMFPAYYIFNGLLITLLMLHIVWTYYIFKIAIKAVAVGKMDGDARSSSSEDVSEDFSSSSTNNVNHNNGNAKIKEN